MLLCMLLYICVRSLVMSTDRASLLGVKFGDSQIIRQAGGGDGSRLLGVGTSQLLRVGTLVLGGEIKNNVNPITKTPWKGVPICRKTEY